MSWNISINAHCNDHYGVLPVTGTGIRGAGRALIVYTHDLFALRTKVGPENRDRDIADSRAFDDLGLEGLGVRSKLDIIGVCEYRAFVSAFWHNSIFSDEKPR
ncbi:MAG: hypothetical protein V2A79_10285 [Planctomycetota bacterium]